RFANGDETNDSMPGMFQKLDRKEPFGRHGGDLKGIEDHLDYIQNLGVTALWLNPALENNQQEESYHGYAITDFYKIDSRLGTNESYQRLAKKSQEKGLKLIMDMVFNHSGKEHWFFKDPPSKDWYHSFTEYGTTNYRVAVPMDINASDFDVQKMEKGWFVPQMPDLNQTNKHVARYLTQNSIWWIEYAQLGGIRMDTYGYNDNNFMEKWCKELLTEYPNFTIVGEVWEERIFTTSFYRPKSGYYGSLSSVTDFALNRALKEAFNQQEGWDTGLANIYYILAQDMLYKDPTYNLIFLDNHDMSRYATSVAGDISKQKMGFATLLTMRGIPQLLYGIELGMLGDGGNHGTLRADMPGGWKGDPANVFTEAGRTPQQNEVFSYLRTLLNWRKQKPVIHTGKFMHFIPENGIYVYFRYNDSESVMVILNNNADPKTLDTKRFQERLNGFSSGKNVVTNETLSNLQNLSLAGKSATIIELKK
ncbi:MAG TPA: alpha-amylase family glycosyl hydrolase, partial [Cyclobacteriaceae bacterium]|nr:alpha-amylase family glycosyl hydrolase [Cyclobacteriaceae bacterium]